MKTLLKPMVVLALIGCSAGKSHSDETRVSGDPQPVYTLLSTLRLSNSKKVLEQKDLQSLTLWLESTNKSDKPINLDPIFTGSHLSINGREVLHVLDNGLRSGQFFVLPVGATNGFGFSAGDIFKSPRHYTIRWESPSFRPVQIEFDVKAQ